MPYREVARLVGTEGQRPLRWIVCDHVAVVEHPSTSDQRLRGRSLTKRVRERCNKQRIRVPAEFLRPFLGSYRSAKNLTPLTMSHPWRHQPTSDRWSHDVGVVSWIALLHDASRTRFFGPSCSSALSSSRPSALADSWSNASNSEVVVRQPQCILHYALSATMLLMLVELTRSPAPAPTLGVRFALAGAHVAVATPNFSTRREIGARGRALSAGLRASMPGLL